MQRSTAIILLSMVLLSAGTVTVLFNPVKEAGTCPAEFSSDVVMADYMVHVNGSWAGNITVDYDLHEVTVTNSSGLLPHVPHFYEFNTTERVRLADTCYAADGVYVLEADEREEEITAVLDPQWGILTYQVLVRGGTTVEYVATTVYVPGESL